MEQLTITFIAPSGARHVVRAEVGQSVMEAARNNGVPGILADCGGACSCATCHVYVPEAWRARTGSPDGMELDMLEAAEDVRPESRLSCQIRVTDALDGLMLEIPPDQHLP